MLDILTPLNYIVLDWDLSSRETETVDSEDSDVPLSIWDVSGTKLPKVLDFLFKRVSKIIYLKTDRGENAVSWGEVSHT